MSVQVSKEPLQIFIDGVSGAVKYNKVGWLPPSAISNSFFHTGNNPLALVFPSPSYLTWPSTLGIAFQGYWTFCPMGETGQYQLFVNGNNFNPQGLSKGECLYRQLAAINANPWKEVPQYGSPAGPPGYPPPQYGYPPPQYGGYSASPPSDDYAPDSVDEDDGGAEGEE